MASPKPENIDIDSGHKVYSRLALSFYDGLVHGISNRWFWNCPTTKLQAWFDRHVSDNHLDIGVGTGYFPDRSLSLKEGTRIGLLDANRNCLDAAAKRIARYSPEVIQANLAEEFHDRFPPFQTASLMYVLHCLPEDAAFRRLVIRHATQALPPQGVLFGATILGEPKPKNWLGRHLMASYNRKGIFGNNQDSQATLKQVLESSLCDVEIEQIGCVALFVGTKRS